MELTTPILIAVREELELPLDADAYTRQLNESFMKQENDMKNFFKKIISDKASNPTH